MRNQAIQFQRDLQQTRFFLCFDLAQDETGCALVDAQDSKIMAIYQISVNKKHLCPIVEINKQLEEIAVDLKSLLGDEFKKLVVLKEQCPQRSQFSTISTLQSLARVHACLDLWLAREDLDIYSYEGIHSVSVKATMRRLTAIEQPTKEDIKSFILSYFSYDTALVPFFTTDITDAIAVYICLIENKWNVDIKARVSELNKEIKKLKLEKAKQIRRDEITRLKSLLIENIFKKEEVHGGSEK